MKRAIILAVLVSGCATPKTEVVTVAAAPVQIELPAECTNKDPSWKALPDQDIRRDEAARNYQANKRQFNALIGKRRVCRSGIEQLKKG